MSGAHLLRWARPRRGRARYAAILGDLQWIAALPDWPPESLLRDHPQEARAWTRAWRAARWHWPVLRGLRLTGPYPVAAFASGMAAPVSGGFRVGFMLFPLDEVRGQADAVAYLQVEIPPAGKPRRILRAWVEPVAPQDLTPRNRRQVTLARKLHARRDLARRDLARRDLDRSPSAPRFCPGPSPIPHRSRLPVGQAAGVDRVVEADGSGPYGNLEQALEAAPRGTRILLRRGLHVLRRPVRVARGVRICGEGSEATWIGGTASGPLLLVDSPEPVTLAALSLCRHHQVPGDLVVAQGGRLRLEHCLLRSAACDERRRGGVGLRLRGGAEVDVRHCWFERHAGAGVSVHGQASVNVAHTRFRHCPVALHVEAAGRAEVWRCAIEEASVFAVRAEARARLGVRETIIRRAYTGISLDDLTEAHLSENRLERMGRAGIEVLGRGWADARGNTVDRAGRAGILLGERATGRVSGNTCTASPVGVLLAGAARPLLERNACHGNRVGIEVRSRAEALIRRNELLQNDEVGIWFHAGSRGRALENHCLANGDGIRVERDASPALDGNVSADNRVYGIAVQDGARVSLGGNVLRSNEAGDLPLAPEHRDPHATVMVAPVSGPRRRD